jgi:hypothetical protein
MGNYRMIMEEHMRKLLWSTVLFLHLPKKSDENHKSLSGFPFSV